MAIEFNTAGIRSGTLKDVSNNLRVVDNTADHFTTAISNYFLRYVTVYDDSNNLKGFACVSHRIDDETLALETPFVFPSSDEDGTLEEVTVSVGDNYKLSSHLLDATGISGLTLNSADYEANMTDELTLGNISDASNDFQLQTMSLAGMDISLDENNTWLLVENCICFTGRLVNYENLTTNYPTKIHKTVSGGLAVMFGPTNEDAYIFAMGLQAKANDSDVLVFGGNASWGIENPQRIYACNVEMENCCVASRNFAPWASNNDRKIIVNCSIVSRSTAFFMFSRFGQSVIGGNTVFEVVEPANNGVSAVYGLNGNFNTTFGLAGDDRVFVRSIFGTASRLAFMRTSSGSHTQNNTIINHVTPITNVGSGSSPANSPNNNITNTFQFINNFDNLNDKTRVIVVRTDASNTISSISSGVATADGQRLQIGDSAFSVTGATTTTIETQWRQCVYSFNTVPNFATIDEVDVSLPSGTAKNVVFGGFFNQAIDQKVVEDYDTIEAYTTLETSQKAYDYFRYLLGEDNNTLRDHFVLNSNDFRMDIEGDIFDGKSHSIYMATAFSSSQAYADNEVMYHNSRLYQADGAVSAGAFSASDWDELAQDIAHFDSDGNLYFYYGTGNFTGSIKTSDELIIVDDSDVTGTIETSAGVVINLTVGEHTVVKGNYGSSNTAIAREVVGSSGAFTVTVPASTEVRLAIAPRNSRARYIEYNSGTGISDTPVFNAIPNTVNAGLAWTNDISATYASDEVTVSFSTLADITDNRFESTDAPTLVSTIQQTDGYLDALLDKETDGYLTNNDNNDIILATGLNWDFVLANSITEFLTMGLPIRTEGTASFDSTANTNNRIVIRALDSAITFNYNDVKALTDEINNNVNHVYEFLPTINKTINNVHDELTGNDKQVLTVFYGDDPDTDTINGYFGTGSSTFGSIGSGSSATITIYSSEFTLDRIYSQHSDSVDNFSLHSSYFTPSNNFSATNKGILSDNFITIRNYANSAQSVTLNFNDATFDQLNMSLTWSNVPTWLSELNGSDDIFNPNAIIVTFHENAIENLQDSLSDIESKVDTVDTVVDGINTKVDTVDTVVDSIETKVDTLATGLGRVEDISNKDLSINTHIREILTDVETQDLNLEYEQNPNVSSIRGYKAGSFGNILNNSSPTITIYSSNFTLTSILSQHTDSADNFELVSDFFTASNNFSSTNKGVLSGTLLRVQDLANSHNVIDLEFDDADFDDLEENLVWSNVPEWLSNPSLSGLGFGLHLTFHESSFDSLKEHIEAVETKVDTVDTVVDSIKVETDKIQTVDDNVDSIKVETDKIQTIDDNVDEIKEILENEFTQTVTITSGQDPNISTRRGFDNVGSNTFGSITNANINIYDTAFTIGEFVIQDGGVSNTVSIQSNAFTSANGFSGSNRGFLAGDSMTLSNGENSVTLNFDDSEIDELEADDVLTWSSGVPEWLADLPSGSTITVLFEALDDGSLRDAVHDIEAKIDSLDSKIDTIDTEVGVIDTNVDSITALIEDDAIKANTVKVLGEENLISVPSGNVV